MRTCPASTSAAALVRAFTTRACHSHLSRRWRSKCPLETSILAVGRELLLQRRQFGERRIGIDLAVGVARWGAGSERPQRWTTVAPVAATPLVAALIAATAIATELALLLW